jgi:FtsZ-binding cell division protein ZapB
MTTNNEAFEQKFTLPIGVEYIPEHNFYAWVNGKHHGLISRNYNDKWIVWQAATNLSANRIKELESEVSELKDAKQDLENEVIHLQEMIEPLQANNNQLREALLNYGEHTDLCNIKEPTVAVCNCGLEQSLAATPAESLQAFKNELIEKCAKVCDEDAQESRLFGESFQSNVATLLAESIRALKQIEVK